LCNLLHAVLCQQVQEVPHAIASQVYEDHMPRLTTCVRNQSFILVVYEIRSYGQGNAGAVTAAECR
jgi:hypothetical protein